MLGLLWVVWLIDLVLGLEFGWCNQLVLLLMFDLHCWSGGSECVCLGVFKLVCMSWCGLGCGLGNCGYLWWLCLLVC